jgi:hypothetical protein
VVLADFLAQPRISAFLLYPRALGPLHLHGAFAQGIDLVFRAAAAGRPLPWLGLTPRMWDVVRERAGAVRGVGGKPFQPALLA